MNRANTWLSGRNSSRRRLGHAQARGMYCMADRHRNARLRCDSSTPLGVPVEPDV